VAATNPYACLNFPPTEEAPVFEEFMGVPAHPLLVHAAVVFVPLLAVVAVAYAVAPPLRPHLRLVLVLLAVAAPVTALLAKLSGDAFFDRLDANKGITPAYYPKLESHGRFGLFTLSASAVLGVVALLLAGLVRPGGAGRSRPALSVLLGVLTVAAAAVSLYYVVRTGDSGAKAVWSGR
jgi:hypothetical protein